MHAMERFIGARGLLVLLGLSLAFAWVYAALLVNDAFYIFYHLSFACALTIVVLVCRRGSRPMRAHALDWSAALAMCAAPLLLSQPDAMIGPLLSIVGGLLSGAGAGWCFMRWFDVYARFDTRIAVNYTLVSFALSACIRFALVPLSVIDSPIPSTTVLCLLPFLSIVCLQRSEHIDPAGCALRKSYDTNANTADRPRFYGSVAFFVEVVAYGLVFGVLRNGLSDWSMSTAALYVGHLFRAVLPLLLLLWINLPNRDEHKENILRTSLLVTVFVLLVVIFFGDAAAVVVPSLILSARNFVTILLYMTLFRIVRDYDVTAPEVYGMGRGIYEFSLTAGLFVFSATPVSEYMLNMTVPTIYFVTACIFLLLLSSFSRIAQQIRIRDAKQGDSDFAAQLVDDRCDRLAERYSLSERELEVMRMIARGRSKKYIAETLYLSEDTIRWHTKQLYRKLDVHNRQELLSLLEEG